MRNRGVWRISDLLSSRRCGRGHAVVRWTGRDQYGVVVSERGEASTMSVYRVIDVIGTSTTSWEAAAAEAISTAGGSLHDLRVAEVTKQDVVVGETGELL